MVFAAKVSEVPLWGKKVVTVNGQDLLLVNAKGAIFAYFFIWIRATWPRYRYDQLLRVGWVVLLPIALVNLMLVALLKLWLLR